MSYIYQTISEDQFIDSFYIKGRGDQFTDTGKEYIYKCYMTLAEAANTPIELDIIAACCEFTEYNIDDEELGMRSTEGLLYEYEEGDQRYVLMLN